MLRADEAGGPALRPAPGAGAEKPAPQTGGNGPPMPGDHRLAERIARADRYFEKHLNDQRRWYSKSASDHKKWSQWLSIAVIAFGALVTVIQVFNTPAGPSWWAPVLTAVLGATVAVLTGVQRIWKFDESWVGYRRASEQMKREYRLYINGAGAYRGIDDEDEAYKRFVENIKAIIAEEQQLYWKSRTDTDRKDGGGKEPKPARGGGQG